MKATYKAFAYLIALGVLIQAAAIALAWFMVINDLEAGGVFNKDSEWNLGHSVHGMLGFTIMPIVGLLFLIVSFFSKVPGGIKWAGITFAVTIVQVVLAIVAFSTPAVGALHGVNALVLLGVSTMAGVRVNRAVPAAEAPATAGEPELV